MKEKILQILGNYAGQNLWSPQVQENLSTDLLNLIDNGEVSNSQVEEPSGAFGQEDVSESFFVETEPVEESVVEKEIEEKPKTPIRSKKRKPINKSRVIRRKK